MKAFKIYMVFCYILTAIILFGVILFTVEYAIGEKTEGTVIEAANTRAGGAGKHSSKHNVTKVKLKYSVDGTEYENEVKFDGKWKYEKGDKIKISYSHDNPKKIHIIGEMVTMYKVSFFWTAFMILQAVVYHRCKKNDDTDINKENKMNYSEA